MFLKYKQEKIFKESEDAEEAFKNIRVATGISDVHTILEGYLKKEELSNQLNITISESQKQVNSLKKKNEKIRSDLNNLFLMSKESKSPYLHQLTELHTEIDKERKLLESNQEENKNFQEILRQAQEIPENYKKIMKMPKADNILSDFKDINEKIKAQCIEIKQSRDKYFEDLESQEYKEISSLYKSIYPSKINKPKYLHDVSMNEDQQFITIEED